MKLLDKMRNNPNGWRIEDVQRLCREHSIECQKPSRGLHWKVSHSTQHDILTIPFKRPIKPGYIRRLVEFVDGVRND
jgi:hypothetical protein